MLDFDALSQQTLALFSNSDIVLISPEGERYQVAALVSDSAETSTFKDRSSSRAHRFSEHARLFQVAADALPVLTEAWELEVDGERFSVMDPFLGVGVWTLSTGLREIEDEERDEGSDPSFY